MNHTLLRVAGRRTLLAIGPLLHVAAAAAQQPFDASAWDVSVKASRVESYRGRSALLLQDGAAWLRDGAVDYSDSEVRKEPG